jgi:predicted AlkP superfamily phosphohydrolase/phosphomutase
MKKKRGARVLAIGLDAAEPTFVRELIDEGELPALKRLLEAGRWGRVESPAAIGSGTVWPTFFTGTEPAEHGIYSDWCWQPHTMRLARFDGNSLVPFWKMLADEGLAVGVLDVPFAPLVGLSEGFEITEWGAHDLFEGRMKFGPAEIAELVTAKTAQHPFSLDEGRRRVRHDVVGLKQLGRDCLEGARLRGEFAERLIVSTETDLSIIIFPEIHHASHMLWHMTERDYPLYTDEQREEAVAIHPGLKEIMREVDSQIARLVRAVGDDAEVLVFSLHGMKPARGLPAFLAHLLEEKGLSCTPDWSNSSWHERGLSLFASAKRLAPAPLKKLYHRNVPQAVAYRLAQPTMIPAYDWRRTRAFALPTDQYGWIRVNLSGRESQGCVALDDYEETCCEIEEMLCSLSTEDGIPLVRSITRTSKRTEEALNRKLPDMIVDWHDSAFELPMRIDGLLLEAHTATQGQTGQHAPEGFCIWRGVPTSAPETIKASALHHLIVESLTRN